MKATLSWLKEYTPIDCPAEEVAGILTRQGLEVEAIMGNYTPQPGVVIGRVLETKRHPNADKLTLNKVDIGGQAVDIVCGAPNVRAGLFVPVVLPGSTLPNGYQIKKSKIRGIVSNGMICSEAELGISEEAAGIMALADKGKPGEVFSEKHFEVDPVFEIDVLPNRPDCLSIFGLAREINAKLGRGLCYPALNIRESQLKAGDKVKVEIKNPKGCPRYTARYLSGVKIGPSPEWLVKRLNGVNIRSINNVVDITNFVLLETGHPLHAFDYKRIAKRRIVVRNAKKGEAFVTLDNVSHTLSEEDLLICDAEKPVAFAGIMGGENSEISDDTTEILLESAYFDPVQIRRSSRRHGIASESSYRFERGADPNILVQAIDRAASLICEITECSAAKGVVDVNPGKKQPQKVSLRVSRVNKVLGTQLKEKEIKEALGRIDLQCGRGEDFKVTVPTGRPDITREADLIEEVARLTGYEKIEAEPKAVYSFSGNQNLLDDFRNRIRTLLTGTGLYEITTNTLVSKEDIGLLNPDEAGLELMNPVSPDMAVLRSHMLPSLIRTVKWNKHRNNLDLAFFEIGKIFNKGDQPLPEEQEIVAGILCGFKDPIRWDGKHEAINIYHVRGLIDSLLNQITGHTRRFSPCKQVGCNGLEINVHNENIGHIMLIEGELLKKFELKGKIYYFELNLLKLYNLKRERALYRPISKFPPSTRDIAVVIDDKIDTMEMIETIKRESGFIEKVLIFDVFKRQELGSSKKSIAFSMQMRKMDGTLTENEVETTFQKVITKLKNKFKAELR